MVLDEKRLVLKGIPVGSRVKSATGTGTGKTPDTRGFTCATCYQYERNLHASSDVDVQLHVPLPSVLSAPSA